MRSFLVLLLALAVGCAREEPHVEYVVVSGDTLFEIARDHGVTVDQLREWNGIEGDLIEVGQLLEIRDAAPVSLVSPIPRPTVRPSPAPSGSPSLSKPAPKPCLDPPTGEGLADEGFVSSAGLSYAQTKTAMDGFVGNTLRCVPAGTEARVETQISVGCTGVVSRVTVSDSGGLSDDSVACIRETLSYTPFPAHDFPDGFSFGYPLVFSR